MRRVLTFPAALLLLCLLTVGIIGGAFFAGAREYAWVVIPVDGVLGGAFLASYARRPGPVPSSVPAAPEDAEPFEDPVEVADRLDSEAPASPSTAPPPEADRPVQGAAEAAALGEGDGP